MYSSKLIPEYVNSSTVFATQGSNSYSSSKYFSSIFKSFKNALSNVVNFNVGIENLPISFTYF